MSHIASRQIGKSKKSDKGSQILGGNQETMNSKKDKRKNKCKEVAEVIKR